jgi:hypothetical protein
MLTHCICYFKVPNVQNYYQQYHCTVENSVYWTYVIEEGPFQILLFGLMKQLLNLMELSTDTTVCTGPQKIQT